MAIFKQNYQGLDDQSLRDDPDKTRVAAGTTGPYAPVKTDPASYRNAFAANLKRNSASRGLEIYDKVFSAKDAEESQRRIDSFNNNSNFSNPGDQALAKDFLAKYAQGGERGLVPQDEMINHQTIAAFQSQQPGQGIGDSNVTAASRIKYPGASGTQTS
jgi:hypothetical protein